ncbi:hypothetical protein [Geodermatophilus sabuli]
MPAPEASGTAGDGFPGDREMPVAGRDYVEGTGALHEVTVEDLAEPAHV